MTEILDNGYEKRTAYVKYDDGEWLALSETMKDLLGRIITSSRAGAGGAMLTTSNVYNNAGLLVRSVNHDGSSVVYKYNELNERVATIRICAEQTLNFDPQSFTLSGVIALDKYIVDETTESTECTEGDWWRSSSRVQYKPGENALTASVQAVQLTGLSLTNNSKTISIDLDGNVTEITESLNPASISKTVTTVNTALGITNVSHSMAGYETCYSNSLGGVAEHEYDGFARRKGTTNYANGRELESVTTYHDDGSVASIGEITASVTNTTSYSVRQTVIGEPDAYKITVTDPQGRQRVNYYSGDGQLYRSDGATYPNEIARNAAGLMSQLHTWRDQNGDSDITHWYYDLYTGAVTNKLYADGNGTAYTYLGDGRIATREWARGVTTTYGYTDTSTGSIKTTEYSDDTPNVTNTYNFANKLLEVQDGTGTTTFGYDSKGRQVAETNELAIITRCYDSNGRYLQFVLDPAYIGYTSLVIDYGYDVFNRLSTIKAIVGVQTNLFTYSYISGTQLISGCTATSSINNHQLSTLRTYEPYRNLIASITNSWNTSEISSFTYFNDNTGKRTERLDGYNSSTMTNTFDYNERDEVTNAVMNSVEQSIVYDDVGNRTTSIVDSVSSEYTVNQLNQYTAVSSMGSITHDADGNLTSGNGWIHTYNAENRPVQHYPSGNVTNGSILVENKFNYKNLRVEKVTKQLSGREAGYPMNPQADSGTWEAVETRKFVWDGFNIAVEIIIDHVTPATNISYYTWGIDLSGFLQGAGGVGGLLCDTKVTSAGTNSFYAVGDANGNVTEYVDVSGNVKAHGEHNAFGETKLSGSMKDDFTHWFSSKPLDAETGLVHYQLRPYSPELAIFLPRDPMEEAGSMGLHNFTENNPICSIDMFGLTSYKWTFYTNKKDLDGNDYRAAEIAYNDRHWTCSDAGEPILEWEPSLWTRVGDYDFKPAVYDRSVPHEVIVKYRYHFYRRITQFSQSELDYITTWDALGLVKMMAVNSKAGLKGLVKDLIEESLEWDIAEVDPPSNDNNKLNWALVFTSAGMDKLKKMQQTYYGSGTLLISARCECDKKVSNSWHIVFDIPPYHHKEKCGGGRWR